MDISKIVVLGICTAVMAILCTSAAFFMTIIPGVPIGFCPAVPVMVAFGIWFGGIGVASAYIGCAIGGLLKGFPLNYTLVVVAGDIFMAGIPYLAFKLLKSDPLLNGWKDWLVFITFGVLINGIIASLWGAGTMTYFRLWPGTSFKVLWAQYLIITFLMAGAIGPFVLRYLTPYARKSNAYKLRAA